MLDDEMAWARAADLPVYYATSNHQNFHLEADRLFRAIFPAIPRNGPPGMGGPRLLGAAVDGQGRRYRVLDIEGATRESLDWPPRLSAWTPLLPTEPANPFGTSDMLISQTMNARAVKSRLQQPVFWRFRGQPAKLTDRQTLLAVLAFIQRSVRVASFTGQAHDASWSSLPSPTARGAEIMSWPDLWALGHRQSGAADQRFAGGKLQGSWATEIPRDVPA